MFACRTILRFCPRETQLWGACGVGARTHLAGDLMMRDLVICSGFGEHSTCSDAECVGGLRQERFRFNAANATQRPMQSLERHSLLLFRPCHKNMENDSSLIDPSQSHTAHAHDVEKNLDCAGAVVCGSMHACSHLCVGVGGRCSRTLQGEHLPHRTVSRRKQSGCRRGHCTCRRLAGNGSDVWSALVQGLCLRSPQMSLLMML